jgi:hypothetical protein
MSVHGDGPPVSTLDDVIEGVRSVLSDAGLLRVTPGDGLIEWLIGERYDGQHGTPPRVFVLVGEDGSVGGPDRVGAGLYVAGTKERCTFLIWGDETTADGDRYRAAKDIGIDLINALRLVAPGRLKSLTLRRPYASDINTFGEEYRLNVEYHWNVPRRARIWNVSITPAATPDPMRPNGPTDNETRSFDLTPDVTR